MVKIPSMDDLKKASAGLVGTASGMVDKIKTGIEAGMKKDASIVPQGDEAIKNQFQTLRDSLAELSQTNAAQAAAIRKLESQLSSLARVIDATLNPPKPENPTTQDKTPL